MLTLFCLYALTGLAWFWLTGRLANSDRIWAETSMPIWARIGALLVVLVIWPLGLILVRYRRPQ